MTMNMENNAHPTDLLPAYALEILDPDEQATVEAHLGTCPDCQAELATLIEVTDLLALAVPQLVTRDGLREQVLDEVRGVPDATNKVDEENWLQRAGRAFVRIWALSIWRPVVAGLILLLLISNVYLLFRLQQVENQPPSGEQTINLGGTDAAPDASGIMLIRQGEPTGTLVVNGLPDLGPEQQYQLWLVRDGVRESGAVFSVTEEGFTPVLVTGQEALPTYTRFGITIEPTGGSPGPTGDGVLRSSVPETEQ